MATVVEDIFAPEEQTAVVEEPKPRLVGLLAEFKDVTTVVEAAAKVLRCRLYPLGCSQPVPDSRH